MAISVSYFSLAKPSMSNFLFLLLGDVRKSLKKKLRPILLLENHTWKQSKFEENCSRNALEVTNSFCFVNLNLIQT